MPLNLLTKKPKKNEAINPTKNAINSKKNTSLIAKKFSATVDRKENPEGSDRYTGDCDFLTNFLKSKNLDWQITDKKILNLIE